MKHEMLPVVIDTSRRFVFIQLDARFFIFERTQKRLRLALAHLAFLFLIGLNHLCVLVFRFF